MGGLGNQMFQYACARAVAEKHGTEVKIDISLLQNRSDNPHNVYRDYELSTAFELAPPLANQDEIEYFNPRPRDLVSRIVNRIKRTIRPPQVYLENGCHFNPEVFQLPDNYCLVGGFQSEKYFSHISEIIRADFTLREKLEGEAAKIGEAIQASNAVCINVRRGDYVDNALYSQTLGFVGMEYYTQTVGRILELINNPKIFIFSDDIEWCCKHLVFPDVKTFYVGAKGTRFHAHTDFHLMSFCKHFIIANSTFSWWGAWLGNNPEKIVIAPKVWSKNGKIESPDRIPQRWIKM